MFYRHQLAFADDSLVEKMSVRRRVRSLFLAGLRGMLLAAFEVFLSVVWVALYVAETYYKKTPNWITALNWTFVAIFTVIWCIHFSASGDRLRFIVSVFSIIDYITIIPLFFASLGGVTFLRVISILRIFRLLRILLLAPNDRIYKLLQISCILLCFVFVSTALVLVVEPDTFNDFWTSFYFVVVAIFTVGFGDVTPVTIFGQVVVTAIIICGVVLIPIQAFALSRILSVKRDPAAASYTHGHEGKHIIIFGNLMYPSRLAEMITEFSIKYRFQRHIDLHIVIMQTTPPSAELRALEIPPPDGLPFIHVLHGSPLNFDDLQRASTKTAECAVTMFDNDHDTCLVHMALKSFNRSLAIFALLQRPEKAPLFRAVAPFKENHGEVLPTVLSRLEIAGAMLARCIPTRGFATLICNLVRTRMVSFSPYEEEHTEYRRGAAYEIYFGVLPMTFCGSNFLDICMSIYSQHAALLIGLMTDGKHPLINPGSGYTIKGGELAIFLAPDASVTILIKDMQNLPLSMLPPIRPKRKPAARARGREESGGGRPILGAESSTSTDVEMQPIEHAARITNAMTNDSSGSRPGSKSPTTRRRRGEEGVAGGGDSPPQRGGSSANPKDDLRKFSKRREVEQVTTRTQITWEIENERNRLVRYHEVAKRVDILVKYYRVLDSPRTFRSAIISQAPDQGHIILTGSAIDWVYYVAPLRNRSVSKCQPIVIVTSRPLTQKQWNSIAHFPEIYMMPGASLLKRRDIERLHVQGATHILITYGQTDRQQPNQMTTQAGGSGGFPIGVSPQMLGASMSLTPSPDGGDGDMLEMDDDAISTFTTSGIDATPASTRDSILIYSWLSRIFPKTRVIMDIKDEHDLRFLHKAERSSDSHIQGEIRNGTACATSSTVERLLAQTVYNPLVLDVVLQLIFGTRLASLPKPQSPLRGKHSNDPSRKPRYTDDLDDANDVEPSDDDDDDEEEEDDDVKPIIRLEQIPPHLKGASYRDLFEDLVQERDAIPLGLYRQLPRPSKARKQQYVCTCPPADTPLEPGDRVYVLFPSVPKA
jgi:voltage-gated potassium channel